MNVQIQFYFEKVFLKNMIIFLIPVVSCIMYLLLFFFFFFFFFYFIILQVALKPCKQQVSMITE